MTWTRLFWVKNVQKAFARVIPGKPRQQLAISSRYQAEIRKLFRLNGVPWLYKLNEKPALNPRDRKPKPKKRQAQRELRLQKIEKALQENEQKIIDFRQQRLNGRPLGGMDRLIVKTMPSWIKGDGEQKRAHRRRKQRDDQ